MYHIVDCRLQTTPTPTEYSTVRPLTKIDDNDFLRLNSADDNAVLWLKRRCDEQWRRQDLLRGGAKLEIRSWGIYGEVRRTLGLDSAAD